MTTPKTVTTNGSSKNQISLPTASSPIIDEAKQMDWQDEIINQSKMSPEQDLFLDNPVEVPDVELMTRETLTKAQDDSLGKYEQEKPPKLSS